MIYQMMKIFLCVVGGRTMEEHEAVIEQIINLGYTREEAINILNGLNLDGSEMKELPF